MVAGVVVSLVSVYYKKLISAAREPAMAKGPFGPVGVGVGLQV